MARADNLARLPVKGSVDGTEGYPSQTDYANNLVRTDEDGNISINLLSPLGDIYALKNGDAGEEFSALTFYGGDAGQAHMGEAASYPDMARFGHSTHNNAGSYGFLQNPSGGVFVSGASGQGVSLRVNNVPRLDLDSDIVAHTTLDMNGNNITDVEEATFATIYNSNFYGNNLTVEGALRSDFRLELNDITYPGTYATLTRIEGTLYVESVDSVAIYGGLTVDGGINSPYIYGITEVSSDGSMNAPTVFTDTIYSRTGGVWALDISGKALIGDWTIYDTDETYLQFVNGTGTSFMAYRQGVDNYFEFGSPVKSLKLMIPDAYGSMSDFEFSNDSSVMGAVISAQDRVTIASGAQVTLDGSAGGGVYTVGSLYTQNIRADTGYDIGAFQFLLIDTNVIANPTYINQFNDEVTLSAASGTGVFIVSGGSMRMPASYVNGNINLWDNTTSAYDSITANDDGFYFNGSSGTADVYARAFYALNGAGFSEAYTSSMVYYGDTLEGVSGDWTLDGTGGTSFIRYLGTDTLLLTDATGSMRAVGGAIMAAGSPIGGQMDFVGDLPPANSSNKGAMASVSDALTPTIGATVVGGGSVVALVWSNGTNWKVVAI